MEYIKTFAKGTPEHTRLEIAAAIMTIKSPNHKRYYVSETYFDFGQGWKWTTILREGDRWGDVQALYPVEQESILTAENVEEAVDDYFIGDHYNA